MAPSKNDKLIWIVLGIGGLYLLSRNNDDDKEVFVKVEQKHTPDWGGGATGTKRLADDFGEKRQQFPSSEDFRHAEPFPEFEKPGKETGENPLDRKFRLIKGRLRNLDSKITQLYSLFQEQLSRARGMVGPGMFEEMKKTISVILTLLTDINLFVQEPGVAGTPQGNDLVIVSQRLKKVAKDMEVALTMHTQNSQQNQASLTSQAFLNMYVNVRRAMRDEALRQQFLQKLDEEYASYAPGTRASISEMSGDEEDGSDEPTSEVEGERGDRDNVHSDDAKFRLRKTGGKIKHEDPNFRTGEPSGRGMSQSDIEARTRTHVFGGGVSQHNQEFDPDSRLRDTIGEAENDDSGKTNNSIVVPKAVLQGGGSNAKSKGSSPSRPWAQNSSDSTRVEVDLTGDEVDIDDAFNVAPSESNLIGTAINQKGGKMQRIKGHQKHVEDSASALADSLHSRVVTQRTTQFKKKAPKPGKKVKKRKATLMETNGSVSDAFNANPAPGPVVSKPIAQSSEPDPIDDIGKAVLEQIPDMGQDPARDGVQSLIMTIHQDAQKIIRSIPASGAPAKVKRMAGKKLQELSRKLTNLKFAKGSRRESLYKRAVLIYGTDNVQNPRKDGAINDLVQKLLYDKERDKQSVAAVWAYFAAVYRNIEAKAASYGTKLVWSDKWDPGTDIRPGMPVAKRTRTEFAKRTAQLPPEKPPGRRLGHIIEEIPQPDNVPDTIMYGRGDRSSLDFGLHSQQ
jgi:hypothetical protein